MRKIQNINNPDGTNVDNLPAEALILFDRVINEFGATCL